MKFEIYNRKRLLKRRQWFFRVRANNGEVIAQSEGYFNREDCVQTCAAIRREAATAQILLLDWAP